MNDERLLERAKARQRIMNSKFESIYYTATAEMPPVEEPEIQSKLHINNFSNPSESNCSISRNAKASTEISFSPQNLKNNSPVTLSDASWTPVVKVVPKQAFRPVRKKKNKFKKKLLLDIDRALMEGRKLRETIMNDWEKTSVTQNDNPESSSDSETVKENFSKASPKASNSSENLQKSVQNQESQTDDFSNRNDLIREESKQKGELIDFGAQVGNHSLPLSASTSYKSPPSEITYNRINQFLDYLGKFEVNF